MRTNWPDALMIISAGCLGQVAHRQPIGSAASPDIARTCWLVAGLPEGPFVTALAFLAVVLGTINVVGGFLVTDRMLQMFAGKTQGAPPS